MRVCPFSSLGAISAHFRGFLQYSPDEETSFPFARPETLHCDKDEFGSILHWTYMILFGLRMRFHSIHLRSLNPSVES